MKNRSISIRTLTYLALLIALEVVLNRFCSINTPVLKIGFSFVPIVAAAYLFGPLHAAAVYALADLAGALLFPIGAYHPGFTFSAALMGLSWGVFLHTLRRRLPEERGVRAFLTVLCPALINNVAVGLLLNTFWLTMIVGGKTYGGLVLYRIPEYAVLIVLQVILTPVIIKMCRQLRDVIFK